MMTHPTTAFPQIEIECLDREYGLRKRSEILQFLNQNPSLLSVLLEAPDKIRRYFPESQLFLQVVPDPDVIDWVQLVLSIQMTLGPQEAVDRQNQLDKDWWLGVPDEASEHLCILLEYP